MSQTNVENKLEASQKSIANHKSDEQSLLDRIQDHIFDPLGRDLVSHLNWFHLEGISKNKDDLYKYCFEWRPPKREEKGKNP